LQYLSVWPLRNPIHFGTRLPPGDGWHWFSPDLSQQPTPLSLDRRAPTTTPLPNGALTIEPIEDGWMVYRR
jgi:hypothetical protein